MHTRRTLFGLTAAGLAGACGFRPVYLPAAAGAGGDASRELAAISVDLMPERSGQLMRQALQERLERGASGEPRRYTLLATLAIAGEGVGILPDNTVTRVRYIGSSTWYLRREDPAKTLIATGSARSVDAFNILNQQYFFADLSSDATQKRIIDGLADQIALQLASWFREHPQAPQTVAQDRFMKQPAA